MNSTAMLSRSARLISALLGVVLLTWHAHAVPAIVLASTTSVEDSGLLGRLLPLFTKASGIEVRVIAQAPARLSKPRGAARLTWCWCTTGGQS